MKSFMIYSTNVDLRSVYLILHRKTQRYFLLMENQLKTGRKCRENPDGLHAVVTMRRIWNNEVKKMTIKEIAKICNVSTATVSNVINGKNKSSNEQLTRIFRCYWMWCGLCVLRLSRSKKKMKSLCLCAAMTHRNRGYKMLKRLLMGKFLYVATKMASFILAAKFFWHLIDYGLNARTASEINEQIRKRRLKQADKK